MSILPSRSFGELICCDCSKKTSKNSPKQIRCRACAGSYKPVFNPKLKLICQNCTTQFDAYSNTQKYCKIACKKENENRLSNEKWMKPQKKKGVKLWTEHFY